MRHFALALLLAALALLFGCDDNGSKLLLPPPAPTPTLSGTAATGNPIVGATVTVKDATGTIATTTTDSSGNYTLDVSGLTPPFIIKTEFNPGTGLVTLYSASSSTGIANIHPLTDIIVDSYYQSLNQSTDTVFNTISSAADLPSPEQVLAIEGYIENQLDLWLTANGLDPLDFNLVSSQFDATSTGFDSILDQVTVTDNGAGDYTLTLSDGTTTQTTTINNDNAGGISTTSSISTSGVTGTSETSSSLSVPVGSPELAAAIAGLEQTLNAFIAIINQNQGVLTDALLLGLFHANYQGQRYPDRASMIAQFANDYRTSPITGYSYDVISFDAINKELRVNVELRSNAFLLFPPVLEGEIFKYDATSGLWQFYGNRLPGIPEFRQLILFRDCDPTSPQAPAIVGDLSLSASVTALQGSISQVSFLRDAATGGVSTTPFDTIITATTPLFPFPSTEDVYYTPSAFVTKSYDAYGSIAAITSLPTPGVIIDVTVTPTAGSPVAFKQVLGATITEERHITAPAGYLLSSTNPGTSFTMTWERPTTMPVTSMYVYCAVASATAPGLHFPTPALTSINANSATFNIPADATSVIGHVELAGPDGQQITIERVWDQ